MSGKSFEELLKKLEEISADLKKDNISLDEALKCFEEGQKYYKECNEILNKAEQKIEMWKAND